MSLRERACSSTGSRVRYRTTVVWGDCVQVMVRLEGRDGSDGGTSTAATSLIRSTTTVGVMERMTGFEAWVRPLRLTSTAAT